MTLSEFRLWFDGYCAAAVGHVGVLNDIRDKLSTVQEFNIPLVPHITDPHPFISTTPFSRTTIPFTEIPNFQAKIWCQTEDVCGVATNGTN